MSNDAIPFYEDGDELTCTVITAAVVGKTFVKIAGDIQADGTFTITTAGAGDRALGVAMWDAAVGERVTVHTIESHNVIPVTMAANGTANQCVKVAALGKATPATAADSAVGILLASVTSGNDGMVMLGRQTA